MSEVLQDFSVHHAHVRSLMHPRLKTEVEGRSAVRYMRFLRNVKIDRLTLPYAVYGRWVPNVPTHPARIVVSTLDRSRATWKAVREFDLAPEDFLSGKGLKPSMSTDEMNNYFAKEIAKRKPRELNLRGLETDHLKIECDREHPVWPSHGECNGPLTQVPFGILQPMRAFGKAKGEWPEAPWQPLLEEGALTPRAPRGMRVERRGETVLFIGRKLSVGFNLRRPLLTHLGWDALGGGRAELNRAAVRRTKSQDFNMGMSGPLLVTLDGNYGGQDWTGRIDVRGNRITYHDLHCAGAMRVNATFVIEPERLVIELEQAAPRRTVALDAQAWRFVHYTGRGMTAAVGEQTGRAGRSGDLIMPALFAGDGVGCLSVSTLHGDRDEFSFQSESYRATNEVAGGIILGKRPGPDDCQTVASAKATIELSVTSLLPKLKRGAKLTEGVKRFWGGVYSCYRSEFGGFSNHATSCHCHQNQNAPIEVAAFTAPTKNAPDPLAMGRFTIQRALLDGGAYGYFRNLYLDSDPVVVSGAGRIFQARPDESWLQKIKPGLVEASERMLGTIGKEGLALCKDLTGNRYSYRWSSNAWDVVGFGHMDAYVNAWTYRGLRNSAALLGRVGRRDLARRCADSAAGLKAVYGKHLINPKTGWVAGWRSRDGQLHDPAFLFVNAAACAFGVLEPKAARRAMTNLETLRSRQSRGSARVGLPSNLLPLHLGDHMLPVLPWELGSKVVPTFETYTDGSCGVWFATFYLRALQINGLGAAAKKIATELDQSFCQNLFSGGAGATMGLGNEFQSWEGLWTGYEGSFGVSFAAYYGIAAALGLITPPNPEWWPAE